MLFQQTLRYVRALVIPTQTAQTYGPDHRLIVRSQLFGTANAAQLSKVTDRSQTKPLIKVQIVIHHFCFRVSHTTKLGSQNHLKLQIIPPRPLSIKLASFPTVDLREVPLHPGLPTALSRMTLSPAGSFASSTTSSDDSIILSSNEDNDRQKQRGGTLSPRFDKYWSSSDLTIRTSDGVDFKTHKARLAGSSVFEDMFEIGSLSTSSQYHLDTEIPIITLTEDARTLELILPFFYDEYPDVDSMAFEDVLKALEASLKYGMPLVEHIYTARLK